MLDHFSKMETDAMFIPDILRTLSSNNITSNLQQLYRNKATPSLGIQHYNFVWDAISYTKTTGINPGISANAETKEKQTLVVIDIVIHREYTDHDLQGFYSRIQSVINGVKEGNRKILPIIIYNKIDQIICNRIHKLGFMTFDLSSIYGSRIYEIIDNIKIVKQGILTETENSEIIEKTLNLIKESGQDDKLKSIKGDFFEFLIYPLILKLFQNASTKQGKTLTNNATKEGYEYDYIIHSPDFNEITIIELKGYNSSAKIPIGDNNTKNTVSWFFRKTYPFAAKMLKLDRDNPKVTGCYITSASFHEDATEFLNAVNKGNIKPREIDAWYDRDKLFKLLESKGLNKVKSIIEKHYSKVPNS